MKYFIAFLSICFLTSCALNVATPTSSIIFSQSDYFTSKNCNENITGTIWIKTSNDAQRDNVFKLFLNDQFIHELQASKGSPSKSKYASSRYGLYEFEIPIEAVTKEHDNILYVRYGHNQENHSSKEVLVHIYEPGSIVSYVKNTFDSNFGVKQYYWDDYEGVDIKANTKFLVHDENQINTYKKDGVLYRELHYKISLENLESGEMTHIKPDIKKTFTYDPRSNIIEGERGFKSNRRENLFGNPTSITTTYDTNNTKDLKPGYQVYYHVPSVLVKGMIDSCNEILVSSEEEIKVPNKILFKTFPSADQLGSLDF